MPEDWNHAWGFNPYLATMTWNRWFLSPGAWTSMHHSKLDAEIWHQVVLQPRLPEVKRMTVSNSRKLWIIMTSMRFHFWRIIFTHIKVPKTVSRQSPPIRPNLQKAWAKPMTDWPRRQNVNELIFALNSDDQSSKPWVQFAFHLFEFGGNQGQRPERIPTRAGQTNYDDLLLQDVILWYWKNGLDRLPWFRNLLEHGASAGLHRSWMIGGPIIANRTQRICGKLGRIKSVKIRSKAWGKSKRNSTPRFPTRVYTSTDSRQLLFSLPKIYWWMKKSGLAAALKIPNSYKRAYLASGFQLKLPSIIDIPKDFWK